MAEETQDQKAGRAKAKEAARAGVKNSKALSSEKMYGKVVSDVVVDEPGVYGSKRKVKRYRVVTYESGTVKRSLKSVELQGKKGKIRVG